MLTAPPTSTPSDHSQVVAATRWAAVPVVAVMVYTLLVGVGLLTNTIAAQAGYLLLALPCLVPVVWYSYGFLKITEAEQDYGLLLSAAGWALLSLSFLIRHNQLASANRTAPLGAQVVFAGPSAPATACTALAILCLVLGAVLSWHAFSRDSTGGARF